MIVKYDTKECYGHITVNGMDKIRFILYQEGVLIYNISDGINQLALDVSYNELETLYTTIQEIKRKKLLRH